MEDAWYTKSTTIFSGKINLANNDIAYFLQISKNDEKRKFSENFRETTEYCCNPSDTNN